MRAIAAFLNKKDNLPLYYQLYTCLAQAIRDGQLTTGGKLPGKRTAAQQLGVSVNTVDQAYQMLVAEGYLQAKPRSGFIVCAVAPVFTPQRQAAPVPSPGIGDTHPAWHHSFATGGNAALFPTATWKRLFRQVLAEESNLFEYGPPQGEETLREAIADYLQSYRGVRCDTRQVVVGAGLEVLLTFLVRLLAPCRIAAEDPGYPKARQILQTGAEVLPAGLDEHGLCPRLLQQSGAQAAYLTPSHQFPTGLSMPIGRRSELLHWANADPARLLLEDDYDSEFRFDGRPLPSLQGLSPEGGVVYIGTFSRSLAPGLRVAYLVLPPALLQKWNAAYSAYTCTVPRLEQHTLARFMREGHFYRGLNRMRAEYRARRDAVLTALNTALPAGSFVVENTHTGLHFTLRIPGKTAQDIAEKAAGRGIYIRAVSAFCQTPAMREAYADALLLGYGSLPADKAAEAARALAEVICSLPARQR